MLAQPNNSSILLSNPRHIEKLGKTDNFLSVDDLRGVVGAAPRKATEAVLLEVCLLRYSDIFGDNSGFEFANRQQVLTMRKIVVRAYLMYLFSHWSAIHRKRMQGLRTTSDDLPSIHGEIG
jgi:hypothetical protein